MLKKSLLIIALSLVVTLFILNGISDASIANPTVVDLATLVGKVSVYTNNCGFYSFSPRTLTEGQIPVQDELYDYPLGLVEFQLQSCSSSPGVVVLTYTDTEDQPIDLSGLIYRKYGPTPDNSSPHWYDFMFDNTTGAQISGNVVTLHFVDGARGDDDLSTNGIIVDQGGPGTGPGIPTINEWGMIVFMVFAGIISIYYVKRKKRTG